ncbi:hypothetical protein V2J09_001256 [Rumex salicifolius]
MNHACSRSYSWKSQGVTHHRFARLNLVDLAGFERWIQKDDEAKGRYCHWTTG